LDSCILAENLLYFNLFSRGNILDKEVWASDNALPANIRGDRFDSNRRFHPDAAASLANAEPTFRDIQ
jgi:hypothetical protein